MRVFICKVFSNDSTYKTKLNPKEKLERISPELATYLFNADPDSKIVVTVKSNYSNEAEGVLKVTTRASETDLKDALRQCFENLDIRVGGM